MEAPQQAASPLLRKNNRWRRRRQLQQGHQPAEPSSPPLAPGGASSSSPSRPSPEEDVLRRMELAAARKLQIAEARKPHHQSKHVTAAAEPSAHPEASMKCAAERPATVEGLEGGGESGTPAGQFPAAKKFVSCWMNNNAFAKDSDADDCSPSQSSASSSPKVRTGTVMKSLRNVTGPTPPSLAAAALPGPGKDPQLPEAQGWSSPAGPPHADEGGYGSSPAATVLQFHGAWELVPQQSPMGSGRPRSPANRQTPIRPTATATASPENVPPLSPALLMRPRSGGPSPLGRGLKGSLGAARARSLSPLGQRSPNTDLSLMLRSGGSSVSIFSVESVSPAAAAAAAESPSSCVPAASGALSASSQPGGSPSLLLPWAENGRASDDNGVPSPSFSFCSPPESPLLAFTAQQQEPEPEEEEEGGSGGSPTKELMMMTRDSAEGAEERRSSRPKDEGTPALAALDGACDTDAGPDAGDPRPAGSPPLPAVTRWVHRSLKTAPEVLSQAAETDSSSMSLCMSGGNESFLVAAGSPSFSEASVKGGTREADDQTSQQVPLVKEQLPQVPLGPNTEDVTGEGGTGQPSAKSPKKSVLLTSSVSMEAALQGALESSPGVSFASAWTAETSKQKGTPHQGATEAADAAGVVEEGKEPQGAAADDASSKSTAAQGSSVRGTSSPELVGLAEDIEEALGQVSSMVAAEASGFGLIGSLTPAVPTRPGPSAAVSGRSQAAAPGAEGFGFELLEAPEAAHEAPIDPAEPSEAAAPPSVAPAGLHLPHATVAPPASRIPSAPRPQQQKQQKQPLPSRIPGLNKAPHPAMRLSKSADMAHDIDIFLRSIVGGSSEDAAESRDPSPEPREASTEAHETAVQEDAVVTVFAAADVDSAAPAAPSKESDISGDIMEEAAALSEVEETAEAAAATATGLSMISLTTDGDHSTDASPLHEGAERDEATEEEEALIALWCTEAPAVSGEDTTTSNQTTTFSDAVSAEAPPPVLLLLDPEVPETAKASPAAESIAAVAAQDCSPGAQREAKGSNALLPRTKTETRKREPSRFGSIAATVAILLIAVVAASLAFALSTQPLVPDLQQQGFGFLPAGLGRDDSGAPLHPKEDFGLGSAAVDRGGGGRAPRDGTGGARGNNRAKGDGTTGATEAEGDGEGRVADFIGELRALIELGSALKETDFGTIVDTLPSGGSSLAPEELPAASDGSLEALLEDWDGLASQVEIPGVSGSRDATVTGGLDLATATSSVAKWLSGTERHFCSLHDQMMEEGQEREDDDEALLDEAAASDSSLVAPTAELPEVVGPEASAEPADQQKRQEVAKGLLGLLGELEVLTGDGSALNEMWPVMPGAATETVVEETVVEEEREADPTDVSSSTEELPDEEPQKQQMGTFEVDDEVLIVTGTAAGEATLGAVGTVLEDTQEPSADDPEQTLHVQPQHEDGAGPEIAEAAAEMHHDGASGSDCGDGCAEAVEVESTERDDGGTGEGLVSGASIGPQKREEPQPRLDFEECLGLASRMAVQAFQMCLQCGLAAVVTRILARGTAFGRRRGRAAHAPHHR